MSIVRTHEMPEPVYEDRVFAQPQLEHLVWPYRLALPLMMLMVWWLRAKRKLFGKLSYNSLFFDGLGPYCRTIKEGAAGWRALDVIYNDAWKLSTLIDRFWIRMRNAQAVRNRLKFIKRELEESIRCMSSPGKCVNILSLACGSAQGVIEVAARLAEEGYKFDIVLLDREAEALRHAEGLASKYESLRHSRIRTVRGLVPRFEKQLGQLSFQPDIVEMVGFLDYLDDEQVVQLIKRIKEILPDWGVFLTCHIHPNPEQPFLRELIGWDKGMLYRSKRVFKQLVEKGGFKTVRFQTEPHGIHTLAVAQKT